MSPRDANLELAEQSPVAIGRLPLLGGGHLARRRRRRSVIRSLRAV